MSNGSRSPSVGDDGVYEVDKVVDIMWKKEHEGDDAPQYRVRWNGFPPIDDTWEPIDNFIPETRRLVRQFARRYRALQDKEALLRKELGLPTGGEQRLSKHVNILSRELVSIRSMRCDTTREPPLWFYLVVWKDERIEDATWESEVYLQHASDLIRQYRAKQGKSPARPLQGCISGGNKKALSCLPADGSPKLFLDGPTPRKQKEKLKFVANLINDDVATRATKQKPATKQSPHSESPKIKKCDELHHFDEQISTSSSSSVSKNKDRKYSSPKERFKRILNKDSGDSDSDESVDSLNSYKTKFIKDEKAQEKLRRVKLMKERKTPSTKKEHEKSNCKSNRVFDQYDDRPFKEKEKFLDHQQENGKTNDDIKCQKSSNRSPSSSRSKKVPKRTPKKRSLSTPAKKETSSNVKLQRKLGSIFGYDTDSDDLTLSPESTCSSSKKLIDEDKNCDWDKSDDHSNDGTRNDKCSKYEKSIRKRENSITEEEVDQQVEILASLSENTIYGKTTGNRKNHHQHGKTENRSQAKLSNRQSNVDDIASRSSMNRSKKRSEKRTRIKKDSRLALTIDSSDEDLPSLTENNTGETNLYCTELEEFSILKNLPEYNSEVSLKKFMRESADEVLLTEEEFLIAVHEGDYGKLVRSLHPSPPLLPYSSLVLDALRQGDGGVAQLLAGVAWTTGGLQDWEKVVQVSAEQGDLCMLMVMSELLGECSGVSETCRPSAGHDLLASVAMEAARLGSQQHVVRALQTTLCVGAPLLGPP